MNYRYLINLNLLKLVMVGMMLFINTDASSRNRIAANKLYRYRLKIPPWMVALLMQRMDCPFNLDVPSSVSSPASRF